MKELYFKEDFNSVVKSYHEILLSNEKEGSIDTCNHLYRPQGHRAGVEKSQIKKILTA